jgi:hypothetical protein
MLEISTSGLMSGDGKRSGLLGAQPPRPSSTLPKNHIRVVRCGPIYSAAPLCIGQIPMFVGETAGRVGGAGLSNWSGLVMRTFDAADGTDTDGIQSNPP